MRVLIVTSPELGWDCVVGVYANTSLNRKLLQQREEKDGWIVTETEVEMYVEDFDA